MPKQTIDPFRNFLCHLLFRLPRAHTVHHQLTDISWVQTAGLAKLSPTPLPASLLCRLCGAVAVVTVPLVVIFNSCLRERTLSVLPLDCVRRPRGEGVFSVGHSQRTAGAMGLWRLPLGHSASLLNQTSFPPPTQQTFLQTNRLQVRFSLRSLLFNAAPEPFWGYFVVAYPQHVGVTVSGSARLSWLQLS